MVIGIVYDFVGIDTCNTSAFSSCFQRILLSVVYIIIVCCDREGSIKAGDRLVAVNGHSLTDSTMAEAQDCLRNSGNAVSLTIEWVMVVFTNSVCLFRQGICSFSLGEMKGDCLKTEWVTIAFGCSVYLN